MKRGLSVLSLLAAAVTFSAPVSAARITFEEFAHGDELMGVGDIVHSKGFVFSYAPAPDEPYPVGFHAVGAVWPYNGRSTALVANSCSATTTLRAEDNNPISLESIDIAGLNGDDNFVVRFAGLTQDGQQVQQDVQLSGRRQWHRVLLPTHFRHLREVSWLQGDCIENPPHMFDNVRVVRSRAVPPSEAGAR